MARRLAALASIHLGILPSLEQHYNRPRDLSKCQFAVAQQVLLVLCVQFCFIVSACVCLGFVCLSVSEGLLTNLLTSSGEKPAALTLLKSPHKRLNYNIPFALIRGVVLYMYRKRGRLA